MFFNPQTIDKAIGDIQKAIGSIDVDGLLLVREDLQNELAIMAPTDTPLRNRLNRIQGNGKAQLGLVKLDYIGGNPVVIDTNYRKIPREGWRNPEPVETTRQAISGLSILN
jgi:hypothetical protein